MKRLSLLILISLVLLPIAFSLEACEFAVDPSDPCSFTTGYIASGCSTYDLYNHTNDLVIDGGTMTELGSTNLFNITINQAVLGRYTLIFCDNSSAYFSVEASDETDIAAINLSLDIQINEVDSEVWDYDVSSHTTAGYAGTFLRNIYNNTVTNIDNLVQEVWDYATRTITGGNLTISAKTWCQVWNTSLCTNRPISGQVTSSW